MSGVGGPAKLAVKDNARSDMNAQAKPAGLKQATKNTGIPTSTVLMDQENRIHTNKDAFLQPAQRPAKSLIPTINDPKLQSKPLPIAKQYPFNKRAPPVIVYNDDHPEKEKPNSRQHALNNAGEASTKYGAQLEGRLNDFHMKDTPPRQSKDTVLRGSGPSSGFRAEEVMDFYEDAVEELSTDKFPVLSPEKGSDEDSGPQAWALEKYNRSDSPYVPYESDGSQSNGESAVAQDQALQAALLPTSELSYSEDGYYDEQGYTTAHSGPGDTTGGMTTIMLPPKLTRNAAAELDAARAFVEAKLATDGLEDEDDFEISMVAEYTDEIFQYMKEMEMSLLPDPHYMNGQADVKWSMRAVLLDWVIQVHTRFSLLPETLFLAVNFVDRFLSVKIVSIGKLQLVGATALLLAAKYEEINCPSVKEMVYMVDGCYSTAEVLKAERFMLSMLGFSLGFPGPMSFLRRISKADDYDHHTRSVAKYFLEVTIMDERFVGTPPSYLAAGAHCLARLMLNRGDWSLEHVHYSGYTFSQLKPLVAMILDCCRIAPRHHKAVYDKFTEPKHRGVSTFVEKCLRDEGFTLPFQQTVTCHIPTGYDDTVFGIPIPQHLMLPFPVTA
ncbi:cyclin-like protein [Hypoxylon crocopeplum]|nr:cyclin-like protein [Hypoxylon crocopeplum]